MRDFDGVSKDLKTILSSHDIKDLTIKTTLRPRDLEYLINYLKTDNSIQNIKIDNYNFPHHNYEDKIKNMYKSNITLQTFEINGKDQIKYNLNTNIWKEYKNFYREKIVNEIPLPNEDVVTEIMDYLDNNYSMTRFKTEEGKIDMDHLQDFLVFLEQNRENNIESIEKIKRKMVQIKKDDIKKKGIGSILSNLKVLYWMKQKTQDDLNKKLELLK